MGKTPSHPGSILLFLLMFSSSSALSYRLPASQNEVEAWRMSSFSFDDLMQIIPTEKCHDSLKDLEACLEAANSGLRLIDPALRLLPNEQTKVVSYIDSVDSNSNFAMNTGPFDLVHLKKIEISIDEQAAFRVQDSKIKERALKSVIAGAQELRADFRRIFEQIVELLSPQSEKAYSLARMANSYLRTRFDPHTHLQLTSELENSIDRSSVSYTYDNKNLVGYLKIEDFLGQDVVRETREALQNMQNNGAKGLTIDLRGNTGGDLEKAVRIAELFLDPYNQEDGLPNLLSEIRPDGIDFSPLPDSFQEFIRNSPSVNKRTNFMFLSRAEQKFCDLPLVIIQDASTASAAEVFIGALKFYNRAFIVGDLSFGKGIVQSVTQQFGAERTDGNGRRVLRFDTITRYFGPGGESPQGRGIQPDIQVYKSETPSDIEINAVREKDLVNSIPAIGEKLRDSPQRKSFVKTIKQCIEQRSTLAVAAGSDRQVAVASEALECMKPLPPTLASN